MVDIQSAVRVPTPPPEGAQRSPSPRPLKRKSPPSRSPSPYRRNGSQDGNTKQTGDSNASKNRRPKPTSSKPLTDAEKQEIARKEYRLLSEKARSGGIYIPPARLKALQAELPQDKQSKEYQRMAWDALKKSINGLINKANTGNLKQIIPELFQENLIRGRGLFVMSILRAQQTSLPFSAMFASLSAIIVSKLPQVGQLLVNRLASRFQKAFRRNDKAVALSSLHFIAHLTNQMVVEEKLVMQMLLLLLQNPTDDSVELAVALTREVGAFLDESNRPLSDLVFAQLRNVLQSSDIEQRTMFAIEVLMQQRKEKFKDNPAIPDSLDLIEDEDKYTLQAPDLDSPIDIESGLNFFKFDDEYEQSEERWNKVKADILGDGSDDEEEDGSDVESESEESETDKQQDIKDLTADELTRLRRTIYLTIQSASSYEEACHKLMKIQLPAGRERELPSMIIETCSQRPTYERFYGLIGERLCNISRFLQSELEEEFVDKYSTIHRYETNRLRSIAQFFAHLVGTSAIGMHVLSCITMTEQETTSSSRIFIKILLQGIVEEIGVPKLVEKLQDPILRPNFTGLFPTDHPRNTRFAINYFTSIGMGAVTEEMREHLQNMPKPEVAALPAPATRGRSDSASSRSSYSSYSSYSSRSRSRSQTPASRRGRSPSRGRTRSRSSRDRSISDSRSLSRTPPRRGPPVRRRPSSSRSRSLSDSRSPPRRRSTTPPRRGLPGKRRYSSSRSRSPSDSRSPPPRRRLSRSPPRRGSPIRRKYSSSRSRSLSASRSPPPSRRRPAPATAHRSSSIRRRYSRSRSRSHSRSGPASPAPRRRPSLSVSRSRSRSPSPRRARSPSRSPPRRSARPRSPARRRRRSPSSSRSRSPPPKRRAPPGRGTVPVRNRSPPPRRSPPPPKERSLSPYSRRVMLSKGQGRG